MYQSPQTTTNECKQEMNLTGWRYWDLGISWFCNVNLWAWYVNRNFKTEKDQQQQQILGKEHWNRISKICGITQKSVTNGVMEIPGREDKEKGTDWISAKLMSDSRLQIQEAQQVKYQKTIPTHII